jgi:hypothetical protein
LGLGINYLYRYGTLIVFANYLVEVRTANEGDKLNQHGEAKEAKAMPTFSAWLTQRREIRTLLGKRSLD